MGPGLSPAAPSFFPRTLYCLPRLFPFSIWFLPIMVQGCSVPAFPFPRREPVGLSYSWPSVVRSGDRCLDNAAPTLPMTPSFRLHHLSHPELLSSSSPWTTWAVVSIASLFSKPVVLKVWSEDPWWYPRPFQVLPCPTACAHGTRFAS